MQREKFLASIESEPRLERVDIAHWAGLGGVRYIPSDVVSKVVAEAAAASAPTESAKRQDSESSSTSAGDEVNADKVRSGIEPSADESFRDLIDHRNIQLVAQLRNTDSAFSLGEGGTVSESSAHSKVSNIPLFQPTAASASASAW